MLEYNESVYNKIANAGKAGLVFGILTIIIGITLGLLSIFFGGNITVRIVLGIITIIFGITLGTLVIVFGGKMLATRKHLID